MNWEALGAVAELLGAIAVLATLIYLAVQVRHSRDLLEENRKIALSQVYSARAFNRIADCRQDIDSPYSAKIMAKRLGVTEDEVRERSFDQRHIVHFDNLLYQNELGLLSENDIERITTLILEQYPGWKSVGPVLKRVEDWYDSHRDT